MRAEPFLEYAGSLEIPHNSYLGETKIGGLSGITYDSFRNVYYAISDSSHFGGQRFYTLRISFKKTVPDQASVISVTRLRDEKGLRIPSYDTEGIALSGSKSVWISNEGFEKTRSNPNPWIRRFSLATGKLTGECSLPDEFQYKASPDDPEVSVRGVFNNQSLESLAISADQRFLYSANELALIQDRNENVMMVRLLQFTEKNGRWIPCASRGYQISSGGFFHSLSELTCLPASGKILALERYVTGFSLEPDNFGFTIYEVDFNEKNTSNLLGIERIDSKIQPLSKKMIFDSSKASIPRCDNVEGMCLGPTIEGRQTLILISDDNFQPRQATRIHVLLFPK